MQIKTRKGELAKLSGYAILLVTVSVIVALGAWVLAKMKTTASGTGDIGNVSTEFNTTIGHGISGMTNLATWLPIIAIVIAAVIILALIMKGFGGRAT